MRSIDRLMSLSVKLPGKGRKSKDTPSDDDSDEDMGPGDDPEDYERDESGMDYGYEQPMAHERKRALSAKDDDADDMESEPDDDDMGGPSDHDDDDMPAEGSDDDSVSQDQMDVGRDILRAYREGDVRGLVEGILALVGK